MRFSTQALVGASLVLSSVHAAAPLDTTPVHAPVTPRKAFPDADLEMLEKRGIISDIVNGIIDKIENAAGCVGCQALTTTLKGVAHLGDGIFVTVFTGICTALKVQDDDVCKGLIAAEGPTIAEVLRNMSIGSRTNKVICATLFGLCEAPAVLPYAGTIPAPAPKQTPAAPSITRPLKFVHISDTHIDRFYKNGTNWDCNKPICCRPYTAGDDVGQTKNPAGPFGHPGCDTPISLERSMYEAIKNAAADADFVIFTGDIIDAALWLQDQKYTLDGIKHQWSEVSNAGFGKVYGVIGNHDTAPVNLFPVEPVASKFGTADPYYDQTAVDLKKWIGESAAKSIKDNNGCYSVVHPGTNLKVISLSTNFWYGLNFWVYDKNGLDSAKDPGNVFKWLTGELQSAETAGQSVIVIGHMPPGITDAIRDYSNYFNKIVTRYSSTIKGMFWGHTHSNEFEITYKDTAARSHSNAIVTSYVTSCVTPRSANPVFRVYTLDPTTYQVTDYDHYFTSIVDIPYGSTKKPEWKKLYNAKSTFGPLVSPPLAGNAALSPAFWHNLTVSFENNDAAFQQWFDRKIANFKTDENCDSECKKNEICQMRASATELTCFKPSIGGLLGKRGDGEILDFGGRRKGMIRTGSGVKRVHKFLHRGPRTQHGTLECGGQMFEVFMKLARDKKSIEKLVQTEVLGKPAL